MKKIIYLTAALPVFLYMGNSLAQRPDAVSGATHKPAVQVTNDIYNTSETTYLSVGLIELAGEIETPGVLNQGALSQYSVIVKETGLVDGIVSKEDKGGFIGAYKYTGYSLYEILNQVNVRKNNYDEFNLDLDLYVEIENDEGEKVVFSWGEIYYPVNLHKILIATSVSPIIPTKSKDQWPLPGASKLVVANDLITARNIDNPIKITVKSYNKSIPMTRNMEPLFSKNIKVYNQDKLEKEINSIPQNVTLHTAHTIFYGKGRGIHSTQPFSGYYLKDILSGYQPTTETIQRGLFLVVAPDGYRSTFTYSEIFNRNDQSEILLIFSPGTKDDGVFRLLLPGDFFSDRAIKAVSSIYYSVIE